MRVPSNKPIYTEAPKARDKAAVDQSTRTAGAAAVRPGDAVSSSSLNQAVLETDMAAREFEKTIGARLEQVKQELMAGNYSVDFDRLAQRMMDDGFGS
jgi:flagellar biosynthesis anti-sigma factor FlgM